MKKLINQLRGRQDPVKKVLPSRQLPRCRVNTDLELARKEKQEIVSYGGKKFWLRTQKFGW